MDASASAYPAGAWTVPKLPRGAVREHAGRNAAFVALPHECFRLHPPPVRLGFGLHAVADSQIPLLVFRGELD